MQNKSRKYLIFNLIFFSYLFLNISTLYAQELKIKYTRQLYCLYTDTLYQIKVLNIDQEFQGYGVVDSNNVLIIYRDIKSVEDPSTIAIVNRSSSVETFITQIYDTGDSEFEYNQSTGLLTFNKYDGIYIMKIFDSKEDLGVNLDYGDTFQIVESENCYFPFWVDKFNIGYIEITGPKSRIMKYVSLGD